jgi:DNA-directed RNA polymerase subunit RPC12/RpoP
MTAKEALKHLVEVAIYGNKENNRGHIFDAENILKELVERDTPIPIITVVGFTNVDYHCPKCKEYVDVSFINGVMQSYPYNYCPYCGQRLE